MTQWTEAELKTAAAMDLYDTVKAFNDSFKDWEDLYNYRANFRFKYDEKTGRKSLDIADIEPVNTAPITQAQLDRAEKTVSEALKEVDEPSFTPPEIPAIPEEYKHPELGNVTEALQTELRTRVRSSVGYVLMNILSENDVLLLSALGIDGRQKILDVFMEECQSLKEDFQNGTSRPGAVT